MNEYIVIEIIEIQDGVIFVPNILFFITRKSSMLFLGRLLNLILVPNIHKECSQFVILDINECLVNSEYC